MNTPIVTWACIVALFLLLVLIRCAKALHARFHTQHHTHIIELASEREVLFIPGDPDPKTTYDYDNVEEF